MSPHHRRRSDPPDGNGWRFWRNNWRWWFWHGERLWQDIVPLICLIFLFMAYTSSKDKVDKAQLDASVARQQTASNKQTLAETTKSRRVAINDACHADIAQDDVLRALLNISLNAREEAEKEGRPLPGINAAQARKIAEDLMEPLGGLRPLEQKQITDRCDKRIARGIP